MKTALEIELGPPHDRCRHSALVDNVRGFYRGKEGEPCVDSFDVVLDGTLRLTSGELDELLGADAWEVSNGEACRIAAREADDKAADMREEREWAERR